MEKEIKINDRKITYKIKKSSRAKRMRIAVYCDGAVIVTSPTSTRIDLVEKFLKLKSDWILSKISFFSKIEIEPNILIHTQEHFDLHKETAYEVINQKVKHLSQKNNLKPNIVQVKKLKTKWGSCSINRNLNFNYKLLFLSEELQDYVIIHELCHLKEMNHSSKFWKKVESIIPNYKDLRSDLKKFGI